MESFPMSAPIFSAELAKLLGVSPDWVYRPDNLSRLYRDGMPRPITSHGRRKWDRVSLLAWIRRHHPSAAKPAANDMLPPATPSDFNSWSQLLAHAYPAPKS